MKTFQELGLSDEILKAIEQMGYVYPMPVQEEVIPYLLGENNDVVALAQTGTGKTAAFGLPILQKVIVKNKYPQSLVLCPTRELCLQIAGDLTEYSKYIDGLKVLPVYGGSSIESQIRSLKKGVHIVVATPGRLLDLIERKTVSLDNIKNVVMDEADEMLNMGFTESINAILAGIPEGRNTLLFSATMSPEIAKISKNYLKNAKEITIGRKNESTNNVKHVAYMVHAKDKYEALKRIVDYYPSIYGIIFCRTRKETQEIADKLMQEGYNADSLHGELSQAQRDTVMQKFRIKNLQLLVATDVAARGLDVENLTHVINYGLPDDTESYTHRSGRTGRAGRTGTSIAIINLREKGKMKEIEKIIAKKFEEGIIPTAEQICQKQLIKVIDELEKVKVNESEIESFMKEIYRKLEWLSKEDLIKRVVSHEFNRFSNYYKDKQEIEQPSFSNRGSESSRGSKNKGKTRIAEEGFSRLFINVGKTDKLFPTDLISLINSNIREKIEIGKIDIMQKFSFFEVEEGYAKILVSVLNKKRMFGRKITVEIAGEEGNRSKKESRAGNGSARKENKRKDNNRQDQEHKKTNNEVKKKDDWKQFFNNNDFKDIDTSAWKKKNKKR